MKQFDLSLKNQIGRCDGAVLAQMFSPEHAMPKPTSIDIDSKSARTLFNKLFQMLRVIFPATANSIKAQNELDELRRQWTAAFAENHIVSWQQIDIGLQHARRYERPFLPSPGQFIAWIWEGDSQRAGLPDVATVMTELHRYCTLRDRFDSPERFPWKAPVLYWIVIDLRAAMLQYNHTEADTHKMAEQQLKDWARKIYAGQAIPQPVVQLPYHRPPETTGARLGLITARTESLGKSMLNAIRLRIASELKLRTD